MKYPIAALAIVIAALAGAATASTTAGALDCDAAVDSYNSATSEIGYQMRRYSRCVSGSQGRDDCSSEFRRLRYAQDAFETAVSEYQSYCD